MTTDQFDGKVVAVTGGASGMGRASALLFSERGASVVVIDVDESSARDVANAMGSIPAIVGDVADSQFCTAAISEIVERHGRIDVLVNAAGTIHRADSLGTSDADWERVLGVNVSGMFFLCRAALPPMIAQGSGSIVNFGSIWGGVASVGATAYCVSKGAVHQLTRSLALDHVEQGIRVNAVAPGEVYTPMLSSHRQHAPSADDLQALANATIPMKRLAEPEEIARVVVFLASDEASYMTGSIVHIDAGYTAR